MSSKNILALYKKLKEVDTLPKLSREDELYDFEAALANLERDRSIDSVILAEDVIGLPETIFDARHSLTHDAPLTLVHDTSYHCNSCRSTGSGYSYHCRVCQFDVHPNQCELFTPLLFNDANHAHTLRLTSSPYEDETGSTLFLCDICGREGLQWSYHCDGCQVYFIHPCIAPCSFHD